MRRNVCSAFGRLSTLLCPNTWQRKYSGCNNETCRCISNGNEPLQCWAQQIRRDFAHIWSTMFQRNSFYLLTIQCKINIFLWIRRTYLHTRWRIKSADLELGEEIPGILLLAFYWLGTTSASPYCMLKQRQQQCDSNGSCNAAHCSPFIAPF